MAKKRIRKKSKTGMITKVLAIVACLLILSIFALIFGFEVRIDNVPKEPITLEALTEYQDADPDIYLFCRFTKQHFPIEFTRTGEVNTKKIGTYTVSYDTKFMLQKKSASKTIKVVDTVAPVITLKEATKPTYVGYEFEEPGYTATDNYDGDITDQVKVITVKSKATIIYTVEDSSGNKFETSRKITYVNPPEEKTIENNKTIYLTFDDGPYKYTEQLLAVLEKYNVKATFFVTGAYPAYEGMIKAEFEAGHTVACHSATHDYYKIYANEDNYYADLAKIQEAIKRQTGSTAKFLRFPGGSSNTVSKNTNPGIMTRLAESVQNNGYKYFDWNVTSGDAGWTTDTDAVYQYVIDGIIGLGDKPAVVLQHDVKDYSVAAVERIIQWGLENGYNFSKITSKSPTAHHPIAN